MIPARLLSYGPSKTNFTRIILRWALALYDHIFPCFVVSCHSSWGRWLFLVKTMKNKSHNNSCCRVIFSSERSCLCFRAEGSLFSWSTEDHCCTGTASNVIIVGMFMNRHYPLLLEDGNAALSTDDETHKFESLSYHSSNLFRTKYREINNLFSSSLYRNPTEVYTLHKSRQHR